MLQLRQLIESPFSRCQRLGELLASESDDQLRERSRTLRYRAQSGEPRHSYLAEALALVREAASRSIGQRHYDTQIRGGFALCEEAIIEMETGEGKTLTATFALFVFALEGNGAHLATSNDYLAERDALAMRPLFEFLGLTVGVVTEELTDHQRAQQYAQDITYGTLTQFGFDLLRDRLRCRNSDEGAETDVLRVMRDPFFLLVDEADALLIDEANMPLVIGAALAAERGQEAIYYWAAALAKEAVETEHFVNRLRDKSIELTCAGRSWCREHAHASNVEYSSAFDLYDRVERAIFVRKYLQKNRDYIVRGDEVILVSEVTGRLGEGRQWHDGIHQTIQAVEFLPITSPSSQAAKITVQGLVQSYDHLAGMTGTAVAAAYELKKVYRKHVKRIPPRIASRRRRLPTHFSHSEEEKLQAICDEVVDMHRQGRPVLIGTRSIEKSRSLSDMLSRRRISHQVLDAKEHLRESEIIGGAGNAGRVTVATSMAGRGTDILISDEAAGAGGLHVILSEYNDSPRQDSQLIGRCGRQGQPGTYRLFLSLDDEILDVGFGNSRARQIRQDRSGNANLLKSAQIELETRKRKNRFARMYHERRRLRALWEMGCDPLLDDV